MHRLTLLLVLAAMPLGAAPPEPEPEGLEEIIFNCGRCTDEPTTIWDLPSCDGEDLDDSLRESALRGDRSAIELLQRRHDTAFTYAQRYRIAEVLLNRIPDDRAIWRELEAHAKNAVRFLDGTDEGKLRLQAFCELHDYPVDGYETVAWQAFNVAATDRRSRPLLLLALDSRDIAFVASAILGFASQKEESSLASIEKTLLAWKDDEAIGTLTLMLACFRSDQADALALQFIDEERRVEYFEFRNGSE